ncbi:hypothetical protein KOW79_004523 [Hemibagrus wyckioides]|uniref:Uncharacterized protein n=1 Tax=Hemibagrus wyckioides TaxID=337641 RepID=A0A9D3SUT4_9TELE|nr:hypothetical protein KOW79_004523 [Hemibagrus wyckioides]
MYERSNADQSVYRRVRAAIAAPRPARSAQRCTQKKLKNSHPDAAETCQDLAQTTHTEKPKSCGSNCCTLNTDMNY